MTATTTKPTANETARPTCSEANRAGDVFQRIRHLPLRCRGASAYYRALLDVCSEHFQALFAAMKLCNPAESLDEEFEVGETAQAAWRRLTQGVMLESQADGVALAKLYDIDGTDSRVAILAVPLHDDLKHRGAIAVIVPCPDRARVESLLFELRCVTSLACSLIATTRGPERGDWGDGQRLSRALERAARFGSLTELAFAITNGLKTKFQCDQVVLGQVRRGRVQLVSLSGMDGLYPRSPGTRLIRQAMEECLDSGQIVNSRPGNDWTATSGRRDYRLHRQWRSALGDAAVASVPLHVDGQCVAVLSLVRPGGTGFQADELDQIAQLAGPYGPALQLVARAGRGWWAQSRDTLREGLLWLVAKNRWGRRLTAAAVVALTIWFCVGTWEYHLSVPCQLTPTRVHHCAAPFDGMVDAAYVDVGQTVEAGQLLFTMDTRELRLRRSELRCEAEILDLEVAQAAARRDFEAAAMARARLEATLARLAGTQRRIEMAEIRAPSAGTIMDGDVDQRVGEVVELGEELLEFAPHCSWAVELHVESRDAQLVRAGQSGHFVTFARPDQEVACRVERLEPAATITDGETVYVARAHVEDAAAWRLAGMDGVATLRVGRRRVWWVALHRVIDFVRLHFWV